MPGRLDKADFRVRAQCKHSGGGNGGGKPCGHLSLKADTDWSKLTRYPHHPNGRPELYAMRQAMLVRLGQVESLWNVLKTGNMLAGSGPTRTKMCNRTTHEALISLAFLGTTALTLADQRQRHGITVPALPGTAATASRASSPAAGGTSNPARGPRYETRSPWQVRRPPSRRPRQTPRRRAAQPAARRIRYAGRSWTGASPGRRRRVDEADHAAVAQGRPGSMT